MITLRLPVPPSTNNLFANSARGGRRKTDAYRKWIKVAQLEIMVQRISQHQIVGPYSMIIEVQRGARKRDLGNCEKCVSDVLVDMGIVEDDSLCEAILMRWGDVEGCLVTVRAA